MNRFRLLLCTLFVVAVTAFSPGIGVTYAQQDSAVAQPTPEQERAAAKRAEADAVRARAQRDAAIKRRQDAKKYIQKVIDGQQSGASAAAPSNSGKGGAQ
jgi:hypothetical protein